MSPPARWGGMESPVKPANDAEGGGVTVHTASSLQRKLESRTAHPLDSSVRWNDGEGAAASPSPLAEEGLGGGPRATQNGPTEGPGRFAFEGAAGAPVGQLSRSRSSRSRRKRLEVT